MESKRIFVKILLCSLAFFVFATVILFPNNQLGFFDLSTGKSIEENSETEKTIYFENKIIKNDESFEENFQNTQNDNGFISAINSQKPSNFNNKKSNFESAINTSINSFSNSQALENNSENNSIEEFTALFSPNSEIISITEGESINFSAIANLDANYSWVLDGMKVEEGKNFIFRTAEGFAGEYFLQAFAKSNNQEKFKAWKITVMQAVNNGNYSSASEIIQQKNNAALKKIHSSLKQALLSKPSIIEQTVIFTVESGKAEEILQLLEKNKIIDANIIPPGVLIVAKAKLSKLQELAENEGVKFVNPNFTYHTMENLINPNILQVNAPSLWAKKLHDENITGKGVNIAILDTGINSRSAYLGNKVGLKKIYIGNNPEDGIELYGINWYTGTGHGSHVAGIAAGGRHDAIIDFNFPYFINDENPYSFEQSLLEIIDNFGFMDLRNYQGTWSVDYSTFKSGGDSLRCSLSNETTCSMEFPYSFGSGFFQPTFLSNSRLNLWVYFSNPSSLQEINVIIGSDSNNYLLYKKTGSELPSNTGWFLVDFNTSQPHSILGSFNSGQAITYSKIQTIYSTPVTTDDYFDYEVIIPQNCTFNQSTSILECRQIHDINSIGIAPDANIWNIKVLDFVGNGNSSTIASAMAWAVQNGAKVLNLSIGRSVNDPNDPIVQQMKALHDANYNANFVVSAGNCGIPSSQCGDYIGITTPGISPDAITVAAVDSNNQKAIFSSPGINVSGKPDITAPGVSVLSAFRASPYYYTPNSTAIFDGTSMSAPHVSGAVALILQAKPTLKWQEVKNLLLWNAKDLGIEGFDENYGHGLLDLNALFNSRIEVSEKQIIATIKAGFTFEKTITIGNAGLLEDINNISITTGDASISTMLEKSFLSSGENAKIKITIDSSNGKIPVGDFNSWININSSKGSKHVPVNITILPNPSPTTLLVSPKNAGSKLRNQARIDFNFSNDDYFTWPAINAKLYYSSAKGLKENLITQYTVKTGKIVDAMENLQGVSTISGNSISLTSNRVEGEYAIADTVPNYWTNIYLSKKLEEKIDLSSFSEDGKFSVWVYFSSNKGKSARVMLRSAAFNCVCNYYISQTLDQIPTGWNYYEFSLKDCPWIKMSFCTSNLGSIDFMLENSGGSIGSHSMIVDRSVIYNAKECPDFNKTGDGNYSCQIQDLKIDTLSIPSGEHFIDLEVCDNYSCSTDSTDGNVFINFVFNPSEEIVQLDETQNSMLFNVQGIDTNELGNGIDVNWFVDGNQQGYGVDFNYIKSNYPAGTHSLQAIIIDSLDSYEGLPFITQKEWVILEFNEAPTTISNIGWKKADFNLMLSCTDSGSGCFTTNYRIDSDGSAEIKFGEWQVYNYPVWISGDGNYAIQYYSVDNTGNVEKTKTEFALIDKNSPSQIDFNAIAGFNGTLISWTQSHDLQLQDSEIIYKILKSQNNNDFSLLSEQTNSLSFFDNSVKAIPSKPKFKNAGNNAVSIEWSMKVDNESNYIVFASDLAGNESSLLSNSSFEEWDFDAWARKKPKDWNSNWAGGLLQSNEAIAGNSSLLISTPFTWEWTGISKNFANYTDFAGRKFKLNFSAKGNAQNINKRILVCFSTNYIDAPCLGERADVNLWFEEWKEYSFIAEIPKNISTPFLLPISIRVGCTDASSSQACKTTVKSPQKAWFDDFKMKEIKPAIPSQNIKQYWVLDVNSGKEFGPFASQNALIENLTAGIEYCFKVKAQDFTDQNSEYSETACGFTQVNAPSNLQASNKTQHPLNSETAGVVLNWQINGNSQGFNIYRSNDGINFEKIGIIEFPKNEFYDKDANDNTLYYYKVGAFGGSADANSETISFTTFDRTMPSPPNFNLTANSNSITISWLASTDNQTPQNSITYNIFKNNNTEFIKIAENITGNSFEDNNVLDNNSPQNPTGIKALSISQSEISLNWNESIDNGTSIDYYVTAVDNAGNESEALKNASFEKWIEKQIPESNFKTGNTEFLTENNVLKIVQEPTYWDTNIGFVKMNVEKTTNAVSGNYAIKLSTPFTWEWTAIYKNYLDFENYAGKKFLSSFWLKGNSTNISKTTYACFSSYLIDKPCFGEKANINLQDNEWKKYSFIAEIPKNISTIFYLTLPLRTGCLLNSDSFECGMTVKAPTEVIIDDFTVQEIKTIIFASGIKQYWVLDVNSGKEFGPFAETTTIITNLNAGTEYCFKVKAQDFADNNSLLSETACATTLTE